MVARAARRRLTGAALLTLLLPVHAQWIGRPEPEWEKRFQAWVADSHKRIYPGTFGRDLKNRIVEIEACRNEYVAFQLGLRSPAAVGDVSVQAGALLSEGTPLGTPLRIRYPGLIPVDENGQYTPDPLWDSGRVALRPNMSQGVWVDLRVPAGARPGRYEGELDLIVDGRKEDTFRVALNVLPVTLPGPEGFHCYLNILFDPSSVARINKLPLWQAAHWRQLERYVANLAAHGQKTITAFIVEDPWESITGFAVRSLIEWRATGDAAGGVPKFDFDFSNFDRFVRMCMRAGIDDHIECWSPLVQPHSEHSSITYTNTASASPRRIELPAGSERYKAVWGQFARAFQSHLEQAGWLDKTYLAFDEISSDVLDRVVPFFHEAAPGLKLMISGGDEKGRHMAESRELAFHYGYFSRGSGVELPDTAARRKAGKRTLLYTAVTPLYPNTFLFSEPLESRYLPWAVWKWGFDGYIRWAWNLWPATLWEQPFFKWHSGDMFFVYPGPDGPVDSIRWEMLLEGLEDYECLWMARDGVNRLRREARHDDFVARAERDLGLAVDYATQQFDRSKIPRDPIPARLPEARKLVNAVLVELERLRTKP